MATFKVASFDVSLTREEVWLLNRALETLRHEFDEGPLCLGEDYDALNTLLEEFKKITEL